MSHSLYYCTKKPKDQYLFNGNYNKFNRYVEIVPYHLNQLIELIQPFDSDSFMSFCYATFYDYTVTQSNYISNSKKIKYFLTFKHQINKTDELYSFKVEISNKFNDIHIYIKDKLHFFQFEKLSNLNCLKMNDHSNHITKEQFKFPQDTLLHQVAKFFANEKRYCPTHLKALFQEAQSANTQRAKNKRGGSNDILSILLSTPGDISITFQNISDDNLHEARIPLNQIKNICTIDNSFDFDISNSIDFETIQTISIIFPWGRQTFSECHFVELDGSFRIAKPYVFCVFNCIYYNESYPIGISIAPTESLELYDALCEGPISKTDFNGKAVLSDMGAALRSFCCSANAIQYFCHRHIIEKFGASCALSIFARSLLNIMSEDEYQMKRQTIKQEIMLYKIERLCNGNLKAEIESKIDDLIVMCEGENEKYQNHNLYYKKWALWIRAEHHVSKTSNHNEGFHRGVNNQAEPNTQFSDGISKLIDSVISHVQSNKNGAVNRFISKMAAYVQGKLTNAKYDIHLLCRIRELISKLNIWKGIRF